MDGTILRETLQAILPEKVIERFAEKLGVIGRVRKREIVKLVYSLVLSAGSDDSGVLAEAMRRYNTEAREQVVRGAFYAWLDDEMADLMERLVEEAIGYAWSLPALLPGILGTVEDWFIFDSETVTLRPALADIYPGSGSAAAVKVHKELSVGRGCMTGFHFSPAIEHDRQPAPHHRRALQRHGPAHRSGIREHRANRGLREIQRQVCLAAQGQLEAAGEPHHPRRDTRRIL